MSCKHDCERPPVFPKPIFNRPGLDAIEYRIGTYAEMRAHMLARIDQQLALSHWTHRKPDDPGIALVEAGAIVGDILSFYQQLYANEAFLRTARWRESVADLVKLLGYRLAPGLGGHARFALTVKGDRAITVPKGFGFKAQLDGAPKPANFETGAQITAYPQLGQFHLYRPRYTPSIVNGTDIFSVAAAPGAVALKPGDHVLVGVLRADGASLDRSQILTVDKSWESFGVTFVKTKGGITSLRPRFSLVSAVSGILSTATSLTTFALALPQTLASFSFGTITPTISLLGAGLGLGVATTSSADAFRAYKISGSFRHFGHNAPAAEVTVDADGHPISKPVSYIRKLAQTMFAPANPALSSTQMPLDGPVDNVIAGTTVLVEGNFSSHSDATSPVKRIIERKINATDRQSLAWGPMSGASTVLSFDRNLALVEGSRHLDYADIRGLTFHQVDGAAFTLKAALQPTPDKTGAFLDFYGTAAEAAALDKRNLLLGGPGSALVEANVLAVDAGPSATAASAAFHRVTLDRDVRYEEFDHDKPAVEVYGNLVEATEGKTEDETTLGDGDGRGIFQTFALPKPPLTYLLDPAREPPQVPELTVYVGGRVWRRVDTLFGSGPRDPIYIVREDADAKSYIQFGDGKTGARLPSGRGNIVARFRTGSGSHGVLKPDAKPQAAARLPGLDKVFMPEPVTGGAAPESEDSARAAAPGRMQSLGRLVSLADFEAEALAIAGVLKARAVWSLSDGSPHVVVTLLTLSQSPADAEAIAGILQARYRARGPSRCPVTVVQGQRRQLNVAATIGYDGTYREDDISAAILEALGAAADDSERTHGLFSWQQRQFGQGAHGSQIVAAIQNAPGVRWVELTAAGVKGPSRLFLAAAVLHLAPPVPPARRAIACPENSILALDAVDITLSLVQAEATEGS